MAYWVLREGKIVGPCTARELVGLDDFTDETLVCDEREAAGTVTRWLQACAVPELREVLLARRRSARYWAFLDGRVVGPMPAYELWALEGFDSSVPVCPDLPAGRRRKWVLAGQLAELAELMPAPAAPVGVGGPGGPAVLPELPQFDKLSARELVRFLETVERANFTMFRETRRKLDSLERAVDRLRAELSADAEISQLRESIDKARAALEAEALTAQAAAQAAPSPAAPEEELAPMVEEQARLVERLRALEEELARAQEAADAAPASPRPREERAPAPEPALEPSSAPFPPPAALPDIPDLGGLRERREELLAGLESLDAVPPPAVSSPAPEAAPEAVELPKLEPLEPPKGEAAAPPEADAIELPRLEPIEPPKLEAVEPPKLEAVEPPKLEAVEPPKPEAVEPPKPEAVEPPKPEAVEPPKPEAVDPPKPEAGSSIYAREAAPARARRRVGLKEGAALVVAAGLALAGLLVRRRAAAPPPEQEEPAAQAPALPAPPPLQGELDAVRRAALGRSGRTVEQALLSMEPSHDDAGRWSAERGVDGAVVVSFASDRIDPASGGPLVYRFRVDSASDAVSGDNLPAKALLHEP